jgi:hypothetical protein
MTSLKTLALAATAVAGLGLFTAASAEARPFGRGFHGGHVHRHHHHHGHWHGGRWAGAAIGLGVLGAAVVASNCYRTRWFDTPYGPVRRTVNVCAY